LVDSLVTDVSDRPIETSDKGERYVVVSFQEAEGKVTGTPDGVEVWEAMSPAEMQIADLRDKAVELAERASKAEFAVDYDRAAAGLKFIELRAMVQATGQGWEEWFAKHVHRVSLRTAQRYMALAVAPERATAVAVEVTADQLEQDQNDTLASPAEAGETGKKLKRVADERVSAKVTIGRRVKVLSEDRARALLAVIEKWIEENGDDD
jgi:hypothetical protein